MEISINKCLSCGTIINTNEKKLLNEQSINDLKMSHRATRCLQVMGIITIYDLTQKSESDLLQIINFGKKCIREVKLALANKNLRLKE